MDGVRTGPRRPAGGRSGAEAPALTDLMPWSAPGITSGRAWAQAPTRDILRRRWRRFTAAGETGRKRLFVPTRALSTASRPAPLPGFPAPSGPLAEEPGDAPCPSLIRVTRNVLDRQWLIADARLIDHPRPELWRVRGGHQVYLSVRRPGQGPPLLCGALPPDAGSHGGRGGRVLPLYRDPEGVRPNVAPGLLDLLGERLGTPVGERDLLAWVLAATADPAAVPLPADPGLWAEGVRLGRELVRLHTFGARFGNGGGDGRPRLPGGRRPFVREPVPEGRAAWPPEVSYDRATAELHLGTGMIAPVAPGIREYRMGGIPLVDAWIAARTTVVTGDGLDRTAGFTWTADLTGELLDLLHVAGLLAELETGRAALTAGLAAAPLITVAELRAAGVLPVPPAARLPATVLDATEGPGGQTVLC